jgi:single stranded DNA-binding protein
MNRLQLIGRLGRAPETRETAHGLVVTMTIATNEYWRDRSSGEMRSHAEWHTCVCFDALALTARDHLQKGDEVYVEGRVRTSRWTDKDGVQRADREMRVEEMQMLRRSRVDAIALAVRQLQSIEEHVLRMQRGEVEVGDLDVLASMVARVRGELTGE